MPAIPKVEQGKIYSLKMPAATNATVAGGEAQFSLPAVHRYHALFLKYSGMALADFEELRLIANGKVIHRYTGSERNQMNLFDGLSDATRDQILMIPLDRVGLLGRVMRETTALNCGVADASGLAITNLQLEVDIASGATAPKIEIYAEVSLPVAGGAGDILRVVKTPRHMPSAGEHEVANLSSLGTAEGMALNRAFNFGAQISGVKVKRNTDTLFDRPKAVNDRAQKQGVREPIGTAFVIDGTEQGYGTNVTTIAPSDDFRLVFDMAAAETVNIILEQIGRLGA